MRKLIWQSLISCLLVCTGMGHERALYVDPVHGSDANDGTTPNHAFATIHKARDMIRSAGLNKAMTADLVVYLRGGCHQLDHTIRLDGRDSGSNGHFVIYRAYPGESPVVSGGRRVTDWKPVPGHPYFVASVPAHPLVPMTDPEYSPYPSHMKPPRYDLDVPDTSRGFATYFAQLYVNGVRAERAKSHTTMSSGRKVWWNDPATPEPRDGIYLRTSDIKDYSNVGDMRVLWLQEFKIADVPVDSLAPAGANEAILKLRQPGFYLASSWSGHISPTAQFFIVNAVEELDEPGEWYLDQAKRLVYYYPYKRDGDLNSANVVAPAIECLLRIDGSPLEPVRRIRVEGITFEYGNWTGAKDTYLGMSQAEIFDGYRHQIPGQIVLDHARHIVISGCTIRHMGSCGLQLYEGCRDVLIEGNVSYDTTAAAISIGRWWKDERECPPDSVCTQVALRDNLIRNTGRDYWQGTGINLFAAYDCQVEHNDISDTAYTALHARIGDFGIVHPRIGRLEIRGNKVSRAFAGHKWGIGDGGHIYLHGRYPASIVSENYSLYANRNVNFEYYADNWSHTLLWKANVSRYSHARSPYYAWHPGNVNVFFQGNYADEHSDAVGNATQLDFHLVEHDDWPKEAQRIMDNAGLEPRWRHLAARIYGHDNLATRKPSIASSEADPAHASRLGSDEDWNSSWCSAQGRAGTPWWQVDLGDCYVIQKVAILPRQDKYEAEAQRNLEIQASNDPDFRQYVVLAERGNIPWYHKPGGRATNLWEAFIPNNDGFRYLRVKKTDSAILAFSEFEAFGYRAADRGP